MGIHPFSVDAQLLRELGERLVGRPHIALAEIVKNAYDADATLVKIRFSGDQIVIADNGHGMSERDFATKWLRVGTVHKSQERLSPRLERQMTGSKGVGRLAAQLLARRITIQSVALSDASDDKSALKREISASINWDDAVKEKDMTSIKVDVATAAPHTLFPGESRFGTVVTLSGLVEVWDKDRFASLAEEIWALQPPFEDPGSLNFHVELDAEEQAVVETFAAKMRAIFEIWNARIVGSLLPAGARPSGPAHRLEMTLPDADDEDALAEDQRADLESIPRVKYKEFEDRFLTATITLRGRKPVTVNWLVEKCEIDSLDFDVRVFDLVNRQPLGLRVGEARDYLRRFGGIGLYDNGFRLPYYGADQDWLDIERDHSARLGASKLVPKELRVERGLLDLPTNRRLFGEVRVSTGHEAKINTAARRPDTLGLAIQVTRDRLVDNTAYKRLRVMLRAPIDVYAMERAKARVQDIPRVIELIPASSAFEDLEQTLKRSRPQIPPEIYKRLEESVTSAARDVRTSERSRKGYSSLLGALATAGMTSLAYEHEMNKQVTTIRDIAKDLRRIAPSVSPQVRVVIESAASEIDDWAKRTRSIRRVFEPLISSDDRDAVDRFAARDVLKRVKAQVRSLSSNIAVNYDGVPSDLLLPEAPYPAWTSIFQNLLVNAFSALRSTESPLVTVDGEATATGGRVRVMDNGVGVDLATAYELWKPFERKAHLNESEIEEGYGGTGLGLTIVRMIADELRVRVYFAPPPPGQSTAVSIDWTLRR